MGDKPKYGASLYNQFVEGVLGNKYAAVVSQLATLPEPVKDTKLNNMLLVEVLRELQDLNRNLSSSKTAGTVGTAQPVPRVPLATVQQKKG